MLPALTTAQARQLLRRALAHPDTLVRNTALQHPALARTLTATDWQALRHAPAAAVRIRAARGLGIEGGAAAWPALCNMLQDPHPAVARAAAAALLGQDREAAAVLLRARLQNPSASPRRRAIFAELLGIHRCTEAVAVLRPLMLAHPSEFLGAAAAQALARLGPAGLAALLEALQEPQARVVRRSLGALRSVAPELIPPQTLERLLAHPDAELRLQAASLLYGYPPAAAAANPAPEDRQLATADASPGWR
jgi:HEAT repeat protein